MRRGHFLFCCFGRNAPFCGHKTLLRCVLYFCKVVYKVSTSGVTLLEGARGQGTAGCPIDGFHVTSYQTNFAGHHTRDLHVDFLSAQRSACTQCKKLKLVTPTSLAAHRV